MSEHSATSAPLDPPSQVALLTLEPCGLPPPRAPSHTKATAVTVAFVSRTSGKAIAERISAPPDGTFDVAWVPFSSAVFPPDCVALAPLHGTSRAAVYLPALGSSPPAELRPCICRLAFLSWPRAGRPGEANAPPHTTAVDVRSDRRNEKDPVAARSLSSTSFCPLALEVREAFCWRLVEEVRGQATDPSDGKTRRDPAAAFFAANSPAWVRASLLYPTQAGRRGAGPSIPTTRTRRPQHLHPQTASCSAPGAACRGLPQLIIRRPRAFRLTGGERR